MDIATKLVIIILIVTVILIIAFTGFIHSDEPQPKETQDKKQLYKKDEVVLLKFPTEKELVLSYCLKNKDKLFSNQEIFNTIKNIKCHTTCGLGYINEKMMASIIIGMQKAEILTREYYLVNGEEKKLLSVTPFGKTWLEEWQNEQEKN